MDVRIVDMQISEGRRMRGRGLKRSGSGIGRAASSCEHRDNKPTGCIQCGGIP